ncbi:MAG: DUF1028 domain-containing protein [Ramlibacter sp.]
MTFSITARCARTGRVGIAMAGSAPTVGNRCVFADRHGAVALLAMADPRQGPLALGLLAAGQSAPSVLRSLLDYDPHAGQRQVAVVDARGQADAYTGGLNIAWAGHHVGDGYAAMGNFLAGPLVVRALCETFEDSEPLPLEERLLAALEAARDAGGQTQGQVSAALRVQGPGQAWSACDLRVDVHAEPVAELRRIFDWNRPFVAYYEERATNPDMPRLKEYLKGQGLEREFGRPVPVTWKSKRG